MQVADLLMHCCYLNESTRSRNGIFENFQSCFIFILAQAMLDILDNNNMCKILYTERKQTAERRNEAAPTRVSTKGIKYMYAK